MHFDRCAQMLRQARAYRNRTESLRCHLLICNNSYIQLDMKHNSVSNPTAKGDSAHFRSWQNRVL
ncbi:uncharacterized protein METZ01_LOCUS97217, partial [marine metagenome]